MKFHYIFNLRDLSKTYEGLLLSTIDNFNSKDKFLRLWRHEINRVFVDRLITHEDKNLITQSVIPDILKEFFKESYEAVMEEPLLLGDFMLSAPTDPEVENPWLYEDLVSF